MKQIRINEIDGDITIHEKTRDLSDIDGADLEEFGKCMFCSIEQSCQKMCKGVKIYEEVARYNSRGQLIDD